jgi:outer membrane protein OmpA-like peptidoglycan-associated protein
MKTIRFLLASLALLLVCGTAQAQFGKRLGKAIENAAKNATVRKAEQKTEEAVSKTIDKVTDPDTYKDKDGSESNNAGTSGQNNDIPQQGVKANEIAYAKSDFVAGDEIIFEDNLVGEKLGEFPSQWDLIEGNADVAKINGENVINLEQWTKIAPLMKNMKNYLSDSYTVEFDFYVPVEDKGSRFFFHLKDESGKDVIYAEWVLRNEDDGDGIRYLAKWETTSGDERENASKFSITKAGWHKFALSFNKRALKTYIDGQRITNVPNVAQANSLVLEHFYGEQDVYVKNIRIAKGAVPLYDRMMTDGKFITYGITFDVGKSTIKPESMGEINRIAKLMQDNPGLKFSVEGHTDSTGNAVSNQKLSDERSSAVVSKLVEMGVAKDRLQPAGKGQTSPIADNGTDEGRAKNRRVEFVKL